MLLAKWWGVLFCLPFPLAARHRAGRRRLAGVGEPGVEVAGVGVDPAVVGLQLDGDGRVLRLEGGEPGHEPLLGDRLDRDDSDAPRPAPLAF